MKVAFPTFRPRLGAALVALLLGLAACGEPDKPVAALELTPGRACSLDGMILADYPGPKAQIHYAQGEPDWFCDTVEMFAMILRPEQQRKIVAVYTQDMGKAQWEKPEHNWIDARQAVYVSGSKKMGSMGPTLAAFANEADAQAFARANGGKVLKFSEVTPNMVILDGGVLRDEKP